MEVIPKKLECIRCGICCLNELCGYGEYNKDSICKFLIVHKDLTTTCRLIKNGAADSLLRYGCILRKFPEMYNLYVRIHEKTLKRLAKRK